MYSNILNNLIDGNKRRQKKIAVLVDPDKSNVQSIQQLCDSPYFKDIDFVFVGGSILTKGEMNICITQLKSVTSKPIIIFPGSNHHITSLADGILLLSLISGRNPDLLIGKHVESAFELQNSGIEILSTSYLLIDGGVPTSVSYMSNTSPIPKDKPGIAAATALAGKLIGHSLIYLDAGSGAQNAISDQIIKAVRNCVANPLIVGGGIRDANTLIRIFSSGADVAVVGNYLEQNPYFLKEIVTIKKQFDLKLAENSLSRG
jgi:phosphoglycerol geranylgeranyltransferase